MFTQCDFKKLLDSGKFDSLSNKEYGYFDTTALFELEKNVSDDHEREVIVLLRNICSMYMEENKRDPYTHQYKSIFSPKDLTTEQADILCENLKDVKCIALRTRIADLLWVAKLPKGKYINAAKIAVAGYYDLIEAALKDNYLHQAGEYIIRVYNLAISLNGTDERQSLWTKMPQFADFEYDKDNDSGSCFWHTCLGKVASLGQMDTVIYQKTYDKTQLIISDLLEKQDFGWARSFYDIAIKLAEKLKLDKAITDQLTLNRIKTFELDADKSPEMVRSSKLKDALQEYRKIPGHKDDIERIVSEIEKLGTNMYFGLIQSSPINITKNRKKTVRLITNKSFEVAVFELTWLFINFIQSNKDNAEKAAEMWLKESVTSILFNHVIQDEYGREITSVITPEEKKAHYSYMLAKNYDRLYYDIISPAFEVINNEHHYTLRDIFNLIKDSPFVPQEHILIIAKGIYGFLNQDLIDAGHYLIMQLEDCLRHLLYPTVITSRVEPDNSQEYLTNISYLLDNCVKKEIFPENLAWLFKIYLTTPEGKTRHEIAHGTLSDRGYSGYNVAVVCFAIFFLVFFHKAHEYKKSNRKPK
jgi:hypothetical protein